jgi:hypothetical protein
MKQIQTETEKHLEWLKSELEKDTIELEKEKLKFIDQIKNLKKEDIVKDKKEPEKLSLWKRIKTVLMKG